MQTNTIAIIGGGNLGTAIAEGLYKSKAFRPEAIAITRRKVEKLASLKEKGIQVTADNCEAVRNSQYIVLAIKPYQIRAVLTEIQPVLHPAEHILISVVTGAGLSEMASIVGTEIPLFRAMPNTAIAIQQSMTCISTNNATEAQQEAVLHVFEQLGKAVMIDENLMAAATVLGACGIAFSLRFIRAASQGGIQIGFGAEISQLIAAQTVKGAASLLLESGRHPEDEIDKVTTPQGCTIAGLNEMEHQGFSSALIKGVVTSFDKIDDIKEDV